MSCDLKVINDNARCWEKHFQLYYNAPCLPQKILDSVVFAFYPKTVRQTVNNSYVKFNLCVSLRERLNEVHYGQFKSGELVIFIRLLYSG